MVVKERYDEKGAEEKEKIDELMINADEKKYEMWEKYGVRVAEGKERMGDHKNRAEEERMEGWRNKK